MKEIWKDIEGYENLYQVSNLGRVRVLTQNDERARLLTEIRCIFKHLVKPLRLISKSQLMNLILKRLREWQLI